MQELGIPVDVGVSFRVTFEGLKVLSIEFARIGEEDVMLGLRLFAEAVFDDLFALITF